MHAFKPSKSKFEVLLLFMLFFFLFGSCISAAAMPASGKISLLRTEGAPTGATPFGLKEILRQMQALKYAS